jgi:hypothetical protein
LVTVPATAVATDTSVVTELVGESTWDECSDAEYDLLALQLLLLQEDRKSACTFARSPLLM